MAPLPQFSPTPEFEVSASYALRGASVAAGAAYDVDRVLRLAARACSVTTAFITQTLGAQMRMVAGHNLAHTETDDSFFARAVIRERQEWRDVRADSTFRNSRLLTGNGIRFLAGVPVPCPDGSIGGVLWIADDRPGRLGAEEWEALDDYAALCGRDLTPCHMDDESLRFRVLFEAAAVGIALISPNGAIVEVNPALQRMTGYSAAELRSIDGVLQRLTHPDDADANRRLFQEMMAGSRDSYQMDKRYVRKNGTAFWGRLSTSLIRSPDGTPVYVIGMVEDVTERRTARLALRASERRYRNLFHEASDGIVIAQMDARITDVNARICEMLGYTRERLLTLSLTDIIAPESLDRLPFVWDRLRAGERVIGLEREYVRSDGSVFPVEVTVSLIERDLVQCIVRDVTVRKEYEAGLIEARNRAEEVARLKNTLLTNISHELRTPLATIIGCADVLMEESGAEQRELLEMVRQGGRRLLETLSGVLEFARLEANEIKPDPRTLRLDDFVRTWLKAVQPDAEAKGLALTADLPASPVYAQTDEHLLRRVFDQLVGNAVKFTAQGSVTVRLRNERGAVVLEVCDTGPGISPEFLPRLFEPFHQESSGLDRAHEGTGLGLAITRLLVKLLGGEIRAESEKDSGTTVAVTLPRLPAPSFGAAQSFWANVIPIL